jgi:hypothetical protein
MRTMNINDTILTETKLQGFHTTKCEGYEIAAMEAKNQFQGGIAICYRKSDYFHFPYYRRNKNIGSECNSNNIGIRETMMEDSGCIHTTQQR